ncbi:hypothetical protein BCR33DRAFT_848824 [Rhizoclosmatium globosum]|uniref:DUF7703 domain-containing protein n=1 Tax=Rhizoclosmatium globosum TaxID=329046 RepID=A0A1Y2CI90_9FUNG|nr:hypothetical protein BCR33DRAFT_848824 [Rhizoclosmatium globosum]|eukprot:ORY46749.1 hypothetical protein BCR33DRAFT_848824 [Rhizoclosmatium globosum]
MTNNVTTTVATPMAQNYFQVGATSIGVFNCLEVIFIALTTFKTYDSLYFRSLMVAAVGTIIFALGFVSLFFDLYGDPKNLWQAVTPCTFGWWGMVTGFSMTMYSRLKLISVPRAIQGYIFGMIVFNFFACHVPTTLFTFGSRLIGTESWIIGYDVIEKIQMTFFCVQEVVIGITYLVYIRRKFDNENLDLVKHSVVVNIIVVTLDVSMVVVEYIGLFGYQNLLKVAIYSIKLKFEFYLLNLLNDRLKAVSCTQPFAFTADMTTGITQRLTPDSSPKIKDFKSFAGSNQTGMGSSPVMEAIHRPSQAFTLTDIEMDGIKENDM